MDEVIKQRIIEFNKRFGLNTEFITDEDVLGYSLGNTIYINSNLEHDYEKTNKHELFHFFEDTEEFKRLKKEILDLHEDKLEELRAEYELRYFGLYSQEDIQAGILDTEIAIDLLVDNSVIEYENGLKVGDEFLGTIQKTLEHKRYLNLTLNNNIRGMNLSNWEKIFVANYYDGNEHTLPQKDKLSSIKKEIDTYLSKLYELDEKAFEISPSSPEIEREYESRIKALKQKGENTDSLEENEGKRELAEKFSSLLYAEYKHIVDFIKNADYEPAFKCMMLRETLTKTYKLDRDNQQEKTIIKNRKLHESISSNMVLNKITLDFIYKNIGDVSTYKNFASLYFAALEAFNKTIAQESTVSLEDVETYGKGKWIKFDGKNTNEDEYLKNSERLAALVKDTQWCTKTLASKQLEEGDFFVFVDNDGKPHIAVKIVANEIDELRGIQNGDAQELEENYRDVALSFLEQNSEIDNGGEWLEKEEWNKRLIAYKRKIDEGLFKKEELSELLEDYFRTDYRSHGNINSNKLNLRKSFEKIKDMLAEYYECSEEEIRIGDIDFSKFDTEVCPYNVILGNANFSFSNMTNLGALQIIEGDADFEKSEITNLGALQVIRGNTSLKNSRVENLGSLQTIGGFALFENSRVTNLGALQTIGGNALFENSRITDLGALKSIGGNAIFRNSKVEDLGALQIIGRDADFENSRVTNLGNLRNIGRNAVFRSSMVRNLGALQDVKGTISWGNKIKLKKQYDSRIKKLTGQDIGKASFGVSQEECKRADEALLQFMKRKIIGKIKFEK